MRQYAIKHMMDRLREANLTMVSGWFDFTFNEKKKYPYIKVTDRMAYTLEDILWEEGYSLRRSVRYSNPGKVIFSLVIKTLLICQFSMQYASVRRQYVLKFNNVFI